MATKANSQVTTLDDQAPVDTAAPAATVADEVKGENHDVNLSGDMVTLTIHVSSDEGGREAVPIGHNGYMYQVPRGKPFRVPKEVAQIISDAVTTHYIPTKEGGVTEEQSPRFAYSITP